MTYSTNGVTADFMFVLRLARHLFAIYTADREAEVKADSENGHRPHYCIHGTNQWTDYDNICGGCEDGVTMLSMATRHAADAVATMRKRTAWAAEAPHFLTPAVRDEIWTWAFEPVTRYGNII